MYAVVGARIHTAGPKGILEDAAIIVQDGKIVDVTPGRSVPVGCEVIDATGKEIVPGFIDAHSHAGMESEGLTVLDANESTDPVNPHLWALDAFNPVEKGLARCVAGGVTTIGLLPGSPMSFGGLVEQIGVVEGMGSVIKTVTKNGQPQILRERAGLKMALGEHPKRFFRESKKAPATRMNIMAMIREVLEKGRNGQVEPKFRNVAGLLKREFPARIHVHRVQDILAALRLQDEYKFDMVLEHVTEGYMVADILKDRGVPCVVGPVPMTRRGSELQNITLSNAVILAQRGVKVAITCDHPTFPAWYLPYHAGMLVREGMEYDQALKAITIIPAEILGVSDRVGSLEPGKDADFVVFQGDPLEITSRIEAVVSDGRVVAGKLGCMSTAAGGTESWEERRVC
ncbi:MAG TPA: amidohydrolase [Firmicutes bacterium]|nr:amidohydrolase [Candidatus Fermentithermobacillaceae bacterium]